MVPAILQGNLTRWSGLPGKVISFSLRIIRNDSNKLMFKGNHNNSSSSSFRYARKAYELAPPKVDYSNRPFSWQKVYLPYNVEV